MEDPAAAESDKAGEASASQAVSVPPQMPIGPLGLCISAPGGSPLHADLYRPSGPSSGGVVLVAGQASNEQSECWSALAGELASLGFEVLMPYFSGASPGSLSETGPAGADELPAWNRAALQEGLEEWLDRSPRPWAVVCEGEAGLALPGILRKPNRVRLAVWISPPGEFEAGDCLPDGGQSLLVICSAAQSSGVRAAQDLFRCWGSGADLFVYEHSPAGDCGLAGLKPARQALVGWIAEHGETGPEAWPSMAESEGCRTEPSRIHLR